jgi:nicotinamide-nucleotide amidase
VDGTAEMIFSGDELLRGDVLNTNQSYLGERLLDLGFLATHALCVTDDLAALTAAVRDSLTRRPAVLVLSGGLGPTEDDLTREAVAAALDVPLDHQDDLLRAIQDRFAGRGFAWSESNRKQALLPRGAAAIPFSGTAPGFTMERDGTLLIALPGVPWELKDMWQKHVEPLVTGRLTGEETARAAGARSGRAVSSPTGWAAVPAAAHEVRRLRAFGIGESMLADMLSDLDWHDPDAILGTRASLDGLTLILRGQATPEGRRKLDVLQERVCATLGDKVYSLTNEDLPVVVGDRLRAAGLTVAVAESCTGGLLAKRLTDIAGSSEYFLGGVVAYDNLVKTGLLGVDETLLQTHGAVSEEVAAAMAEGVCRAIGADCGLSTTGIAGPDGGSEDKPVGLVYVGSVVKGVTRVERLRLWGARDQIRERAACSALDLLRRRLPR